MRKSLRSHWLFILLLIILSTFFFLGIAKIPFHPDESTHIFMSADFERLLNNPLLMAWDGGKPISDLTRYRMIDAPLTRYLLGIGRSLSGLPPLAKDWDWSASWELNKRLGAFPNDRLLLIERLTIASLFPMSLLLLYLIGLKLDGRLMGISTILMFSLHPLILLHTRRAMAEGMLVFGVILTLYSFTIANKRPLFAGLAVALAFNAKHSAILLFPIGLLAVSWLPKSIPRKDSKRIINLSRYLLGFILLTALLNPIYWRKPIAAFRESIIQRQNLLNRQVADFTATSTSQVLESPSRRAAVQVAQLFIAPPIFSEVGNYRLETSHTENVYLNTPGNNLGRSSISVGIMLGLTMLGIFNALQISYREDFPQRRIIILFLLSFLVTLGGIILLIPLAWQRYSVPLIPFICIFASLGLIWVIKTSRRIFSHGRLSARLSEILTQFSPNSWMP